MNGQLTDFNSEKPSVFGPVKYSLSSLLSLLLLLLLTLV